MSCMHPHASVVGRKQACGWSWLAADGAEHDTAWQENVFHVALSTATDTFLWWQPVREWVGGKEG